MRIKLTTELFIKIILWMAFWGLLVLLSAPLMAESSTVSRTSKTISFSQTPEVDKSARDDRLEQAKNEQMPALVKQGFRQESTVMAVHMVSSTYQLTGDITIYDASTDLISDFNEDGFYHRFSVAIDADTVYNTSYIFARLYLSYEGGPWNHFATSDNYHIHSDSEHDVFVIETELADGFTPGYYDVRIELYDADYGDWLLSYGPYNDASLSALPLEDSYYDDYYRSDFYPVETEIVLAGHGHGSISGWLFALPVLILLSRRFKQINR